MFRHGKYRMVSAVAFAMILSAVSFAVFGTSSATVPVKLTPVMVSSDTSTLPPDVAKAEMAAVWRLFDRDTDTAYTPAQTARITVSLPALTTINRIRLYGASSYQLNVYWDNNGTWVPIPSLTGVDLTTLGSSWNALTPSNSFSTAQLLLEFIPQGNVTAGIREIELWGPEVSTIQESAKRLTLDGIRTAQDALSVLSVTPSHILEFTASPSEVPLSDAYPTSLSISLTQNPVLFKRAYIMYDGYNLVRPVSVFRRINNLSWSGGFVISSPDGALPSWASYTEEINPSWLVQGVNTFDFRSPGGTAIIRNLQLIVETDSGWNSVSSVSPSTLYDGDLTTSYAITASSPNPLVEITFERPVQPDTIRLNLPGPLNVKAGLQYQSGDSWQDVQSGWQIDLSTMQAGWNDISVPSAVSATGLRLILLTDSLAPGTVVGSINEIRVSASPAGPMPQTSRIVISYPRDGEYFGRSAFIQGFVTPSVNSLGSAASVTVETKPGQSAASDGAISLSLTKDETRFYTQADNEEWEPIANTDYAGQPGASQSVLLNKNSGLSGTSASGGGGVTTDNREQYTDKVSPGQAKKIQYKGVTLDIPAGAVDQDTQITIIPLTGPDLARLDPGMINVTFPDAGYRFLPHGMKFKKAIKISFGYSKQLFAAGQVDDDVQMYFYNEKFLHWEKLSKNKVDKALSVVESNSDHFTDIINSTLVVPEHPEALSFNPNSIKDIKAADPSANVNLIEPPRSNNKGTANLSYPIEVPPGRNKLQPNIAVQYNSSGGNGWMGLGWDIPLQAITIDTRWGVPRYDTGQLDQEQHIPKETETYTLDGEQLAPVAHRGDLVSRTPDKIFHTRVEGQFRKIIRHGSQPNNYWWEVIDKNGTKYFYGGDASTNGPAADSVLADGSGNVFKWALRKIQDTNGNFIKYNYKLVQDSGLGDGSGGVAGYQLYLKVVQYTGHGTTDGPYTVLFKRDRNLGEPRRKDINIDARGGFKMVTADLLRRIEVYFGGSYVDDGSYSEGAVIGGKTVRSYEFKYNENPYGDNRPDTAFKKTLLTSVAQYGKDGSLFNTHRFSYFDEARDTSGNYLGFSDFTGWGVGSDADKINAPSLLGHGPASALGGNTGTSAGGHIYIGIGSPDGKVTDKTGTGGLKVGYNQSESEALLTMADMDGDGLPDKVLKGDDGFYYRKNLSGPHGGAVFGDPVKLVTLPAISHENVTSTTIGGEVYVGIDSTTNESLVLMYDKNFGENESDTYFADVNGDGLIDVVSNGMVWFNHLENGVPTFTLNSVDTPSPIRMGTIDTNGLIEDPSAEETKRAAAFPLLDTVRRWVAPYDGTVRIAGDVRLVDFTKSNDPGVVKKRQAYKNADGVRVAVQLEGGELWSSTIAADDYEQHVPTGVDSVPVHRGDRVYFRVQSLFNGAYDQVAWDPIVSYLNVDATRTDVNSLTEYSYRASQDFTLAGRRTTVIAPLTGTLHLTGTWEKTGATTDDVTLLITKNGAEAYRHTLGSADTAAIDLSQDLAVTQLDVLEWSILVDSPIDATQIKLTPGAYYTSADGVDDVKDDQGKYVITVDPTYDMDLYPVTTLTAPQEFWTAPQTGTLAVLPGLDLKPSVKAPTKVAFTAKRRNALLGKGIIEITRDADGNLVIAPVTLNISVNQGDQVFFDFSTRDVNLADQVLAAAVHVSYNGTPPIDVPSAFHSAATEDAFPVPYRGWGATGYNGNSPRDSQPINQSLLVIDSSYDANNARVYPFAPLPSKELWGGVDDSVWVKAGEASSSRLGLKNILLPHSDKFAGLSAPSRISESTNDAVEAGFGASKGESHSKIEFQDLNGDGFPDVIGNSGVQYTRGTGDLDLTTKTNAGLGSARSSINESFNASTEGAGNIAKAIGNARGNDATNGRQSAPTAQQGSDMPKFGLSGGYGTADTDYDLIDVNGDGLPDKVYRDGTVKLNLGYSFSTVEEQWGGGIVNNGQTISGGANLGFNLNHYSIAGGLNLGIDTTRSDETYVDINGDGLPDKVTVNSDGLLFVRLNTGAGFTDPIAWKGGFGKVAVDNHISLGGGALITFGFKIPVPPPGFRIVINPGINFSTSMGRPEVAFRDMDGKGYVDQVYSTNDSELRVAQNQIGRTNLLKSVKRPLGGSITLEYQREGNTYDMPQSQWNMTRSTLTDGMGNTYRTDYSYAGGYKDRFERDFYGFQTVTETHAPGTLIQRTITETFNNRDFYLKGLLLKSVTTDKTGRVWAKTANTYSLTPVQDYDFTEFSALTKTDTYFYDGSNPSEDAFNKSTYQTFAYDSYGNVTKFFDAGEVFTSADDVTATITYFADTSAYIVGKPATIIVTDASGKQLRSRSAVYYQNGTGNLHFLTLNNTTSPSVWTMTYDDTNGNLLTITDPVGYVLQYTYDDDTSTHVTKILDNFPAPVGPYYSTATYNPLFGQIATSVDLNKNTQANRYDEFGRLACVYGPYDTAPIDPNVCTDSGTITFAYTSPVISATDGESLQTPARAVTFNRAVSVKGHDPIIIKTITYIDGMKRIIETKKDADVSAAGNGTSTYGMTVSGKVVFDDLGRVVQQGQPIFEAGYTADFSNYLTAKNPTLFSYDPLDRTTMVMTPDAKGPGKYATTTTTYGFGQVNATSPVYATTKVVDPIGNAVGGGKGTKVSYKDVDDRIIAVVEYNNTIPIITTYDYDPLGQITSVWDDKKNHTTIAYDQLGRRTMIDNPDTGSTLYGYDANGNLISKLTANYQKNQAITYTYAFNRLQSINYPFSAQVKYDYGTKDETGDQLGNRAGRIKKVTDESGVEERYYGRLGETLKEEKTPTGAKTSPVQNMKFTTQYVFDSFGRMIDMTYPDGEALHYTYDNGGLLKAAWGIKNSTRYDYIMTLLYDEYGQRTHIEYGNGTKTDYTYDPLTRRLATLNTGIKDGSMIQQLSYTYDLVGNVMNLHNGIGVPTNTALPAGPVNQNFVYDDLYQLQHGDGTNTFGPGKGNNYTNDFIYDTIGNMMNKKQVHTIVQPNTTSTHLPKETNYVLSYTYGSPKPHAVTDDGNKLYAYDPAGNMTGWTSKTNGTRRTIIWNEENRVQEIDNNGQKTYFLYDDAGERVIKRGQHGETVYVNRFYAIRNGELGTKHVFAGETRVLSKLVKTPPTNTANTTGSKTVSTTTPVEKDQFFYHGDHLGSSNMITDSYGAVYQHLEYFPYGETWIEEGGSYGGNTPGYKFTGKELDPETGLYYYGARYYDPVLSRWISADPILSDYLPNRNDKKSLKKASREEQHLPGGGGIFRPINLSLFTYAGSNPVRYKDLDGRELNTEGTPEFKQKEEKQIETVRSTPTGKEKIESLEKSKNVWVIKETKQGSYVDPNNPEAAQNGAGTGGTIYHNPNKSPKVPTTQGPQKTRPEVVLGHELQHAVDDDKGILDTSINMDKAIRNHEIKAIKTENAIRRELGIKAERVIEDYDE